MSKENLKIKMLRYLDLGHVILFQYTINGLNPLSSTLRLCLMFPNQCTVAIVIGANYRID